MRAPLLSSRRLCAAVVVLGVVSAAALLLLPVEAAFAGDPLLRLRSVASTDPRPVTDVDCGSVARNLWRHSEGLSLYDLARDGACRRAASRRAAGGVAAGGVMAMLGLLGLAAPGARS